MMIRFSDDCFPIGTLSCNFTLLRLIHHFDNLNSRVKFYTFKGVLLDLQPHNLLISSSHLHWCRKLNAGLFSNKIATKDF